MKRINTIVSIILIIAILTIAGCSSSKKNDETSETNESIQTDGADETSDSKDQENQHSAGIDNNGYWKDVTALDYVSLPEYTGIIIPTDIHNIPDETVQTQIDTLLSQYTYENQVTDRAIKDGDTVNIDYVGSVDGVEFEGGSTGGNGTNVTIGVTSYIDDFLEQLIGHTPGESFDVEVTFPEDYGKESLNGKDAVFAVTVNHIVETITPELSDDFVSENLSANYEWNSVSEMKEGIKEDLKDLAIQHYVQDYIAENSTVSSLPDSLLEYQENVFIDYYKASADQYGMELDEFISSYLGFETTDELLENYSEDLKKTANYYLIVQAIAEEQEISNTKEDLAGYFSEYVGTEDYSQYEATYGLPYLMMTALHQSVLDYMMDHAILE